MNGGEHSLLSILPHLTTRGIEVVVAGPPASDFEQSVQETNSQFVSFCASKDGSKLPPDVLDQQLVELVDTINPAHVHANSLSMGRLLGRITPVLARPTTCHIRDIIRLSKKAVRDLNQLAGIVCVSNAVREWFSAIGIDLAKTQVVYNGVDSEVFAPRDKTGWLAKEIGICQSVPIILSVGQIGMRKGLMETGHALSQLAADGLDFAWVVVGLRHSMKDEAIKYENDLYHLCNEKPLCGRVHFLGRRNDVARIMNESTVLVHAAKQEPLGRVLLEAAASGLPVVATNVGGTKEIFSLDGSACLVDSRCIESLIANISLIFQSQQIRIQMGQTARKQVATMFSLDQAATGFIEFVKRSQLAWKL